MISHMVDGGNFILSYFFLETDQLGFLKTGLSGHELLGCSKGRCPYTVAYPTLPR